MRMVGYGPQALVGAYGPQALVGALPYAGGGYALHPAVQQALAAGGIGMAPAQAPQVIGSWPGSLGAPQVQAPAAMAVQGGQFPVGFGPQLIPKSGQVTNVVSRNQVDLFQPVRLSIIDSAANPAASFSIIDLKHGNKSQLINSNAIPAAGFIQTATDSLVSFTAVKGGIDMTVEVSNLDAAADHTFQAMYFGRAIGV